MGAVVLTVRVALAGCPKGVTVTGSHVANEGSCEQVNVMIPFSPPAGVTESV